LKLPAALAFALAIAPAAFAQTPPPATPTPTISSQSILVLVPALVREKKSGQLIYTFKADDFVLTDDGVPQKLHLEEDTGGEPLALVVDIEGGGAGAGRLLKDMAIAEMLDSIVGGVPHKIAIVGYDSSPVLVTDFTPDADKAADGIAALIKDDNGDSGAATLDSIGFSVDLLREQPLEYRRAILLISESNDRGSKLSLDDALHAISDTNTTIYSIGFSTVTADLGRNSAKALGSSTPGPAHGCMSRDPNDPNVDLSKSVAEQAFDCLGLLAPPLELARQRRPRGPAQEHSRNRRPPHRRRVLQVRQREEPGSRPAHHLQPHPQPLHPQLPAAVSPPRLPRHRAHPARLLRCRSLRPQRLLGRRYRNTCLQTVKS
jgi:hypothetical protein